MPLLVFVVGLLFLMGPFALIAVLVLRRDIDRLNRRVASLERMTGAAPRADAGTTPAPAQPPQTSRIAPAAEPVPAAEAVLPAASAAGTPAPSAMLPGPRTQGRAPRPATPRLDLETILGGQWLTWLGVLAVFFGTAFFLAYDLGDHPMAGTGQVLTGLLVGGLFVTAGRTLTARLGRFLSRGLLGGGVALLFLGAYASYAFHHLVPVTVVYPFLFGAALVGAALALGESSLMVASLTLIGALLTPLFLAGGRGPAAALFVYLAAVNLGTQIVSRRRPWPLLPILGFVGLVLLVTWWWAEEYSLDVRGTAAAGIGVLWLMNAAAPLTAPAVTRGWGAARGLALVANALLFEVVLFALFAPDLEPLRGLATGLLALAYVAAARAVEAARGESGPVRLTRHAGLLLAAVAVPVQFDLQWVTLGWALLALVLLQAGLASPAWGERLLGYGILALAVLRALLWDTEAALSHLDVYRPVVNGNFLVGIATSGALGLAAWIVARARPRLPDFEKRLVTPLILTSAVVLLVRICVEVVASFEVRAHLAGVDLHLAMMLTLSLVSAVYAGVLILAGFGFHYRPVRFLGIVVLALVVLKVFTLDIQELERGYRIASFIGVGALLLVISFLYQRERRRS